MSESARRRLPRGVRLTYLRYRRLGAAVCAAGAVLALGNVLSPGPAQTIPVVVAADDLDGGAALTPADLRVVRMPPAAAPSHVADSPSRLVGRLLTAPVRSGEPITDRRVLGRSLVAGYPPGIVAAPIRLPDPGVAGLLDVGDQVDVYAATGAPGRDAALLVAGARVVLLPASDPSTTDVAATPGGLVVLAVTAPEAAELAQASATSVLSVVLRN